MIAPRRLRCLMLVACIAGAHLTPGSVAAQERQQVQSPARDPRDAGFDAWRVGGADGLFAPPLVLPGERYQILVQSAALRNRPSTSQSLQEAIAACAAAGFDVGSQERQSLVQSRAFQQVDQSVAGMPMVALTIVPLGKSDASCTNSPAQEQSLLEFGIEFGFDTLGLPERDAHSVEVYVGNRRVQPTAEARALLKKVGPEGYVGANGLSAIRLYLTLDALLPQGTGNATLRLLIFNGQDSAATEMVVHDAVVRELRRELVAWSARRLEMTSEYPPEMPIAVPTPRDPLLRAAHASYERGDYAAASVAALQRVDARGLTRDDRTSGLMQLGLTFAAAGEEAAARVMLREAMMAEPCLRLPAAVPARYSAMLDEYRRPYRCEPVAFGRILKASVVPGGITRALYPERGIGAPQIFAVTVTAVAAVALRISTNSMYAEYQDEIRDSANELYEIASERNQLANMAAVAFWASYAWPVVRTAIEERRFERRLSGLTNYGSSSPRVSVTPSTQGVGLAIHFF